jgi:alkaline phosphatase D
MISQKTLPSAIDRRRFLEYAWRGVPGNPHIKYYEGDRRGYFKASVTPKHMRLDLRFVTSVESPGGTGYTERSWVVEDGRPGAQDARGVVSWRGLARTST